MDYVAPEDDLPLDGWESIPIANVEDVIVLGLSSPSRGFTVNLRARMPWCGAILCFARTGEITFGVSVDDPLGSPESLSIAKDLLHTLCDETQGSRGWAAHEMPPSLDPRRDRPWDNSVNLATYARHA